MYKALFVDDNRIQIKSLQNYISWENFGFDEIKVAYDAFEAIEICRDYIPDLVVTDIAMPDMNGLELSARLGEMGIKTQYIYISCYQDAEYLKGAITNNAVDYIVKPLKPTELECAVQKACDILKTLRNSGGKTENVDVFRENFICRLLNSFDITNQDIKEDADRLGFRDFKCFAVAAIKLAYKENRDMRRIESNFIRQIKLLDDIVVYGDLSREIVILFMIRSNEYKGIYSSVCDIMNRFSEKYDIDVYGGVSDVLPDISEFKMMFSQAEQVLLYNGEHLKNGLVTYFEVFNKTEEFDFEDYGNTLRKLIFNFSSKKERNIFIENLKKQNGAVDVEFFAELYVYTLSELNKIFEESGLTIKQVFGNVNFFVKDRKRFEDADRFYLWLNNIIETSIEHLFNYKNNESFRISEKIIFYITENFHCIESVEEIATNINVSYSYARGVFKKETGMTMLDYLTFVRMEYAKKLLGQGECSVTDVAQKVGYADAAYFRTIFKKNVGIGPREFKERREKEKNEA